MKTNEWKVEEWFSADREATRWNDMYSTDRPRPEEVSFRRRRDHAVSFVARTTPAGGEVLDLGCGTGALTLELVRSGFKATGVDYAPDMLRFARQRLQASGFEAEALLRGDAANLPFRDAHFDCVVCLGVISYQEDYTEVLTEIRRILKPGCPALITFRNVLNPVFSDPWESAKALGRFVIRGERPHAVGMGRALHPGEVRRDIERAGLTFEAFAGVGLGPARWSGRQLVSDRAAIQLDGMASRALRRVGLGSLAAWAADVAMFECRRV